MFIERLEFGVGSKYNALESSIHLGRYLLAQQYCRDKKVLDIACGEGYGSFALAEKWGASEVHAVDISVDAINKAKTNFKRNNITYSVLNAEVNSGYFEENYFDLIVSFETIEHLKKPELYLENLKRWVKKNGIIIISCPNDSWYYNTPDKRNPFHERKYTFQQFVDLCESILGKSRGYMFGVPVSGFSNVNVNSQLIQHDHVDMGHMLNFQIPNVIMLPTGSQISSSNVSYFVGIWGPDEIGIENTCCIFGTSMDDTRIVSYSNYLEQQEIITRHAEEKFKFTEQIHKMESKIDELSKENNMLNRHNKKLSLSIKGANKENEFLRQNIQILKERLAILEQQEANVKQLEEELHALLNSKSWRITAPLRKLMNIWKR
ncbi:methyltransferase domain-containing protein [Paenibacillus cisolokensis]|uniref:methyltransferase domain-containing protein n=1 Tax=Paenibacillus cisolokensis TaxID=1658519 RepID=UPI003D269C56